MVYRALGGGWQIRLDGCPPNTPNLAKVEIVENAGKAAETKLPEQLPPPESGR
jgi:hypothetical protein